MNRVEILRQVQMGQLSPQEAARRLAVGETQAEVQPQGAPQLPLTDSDLTGVLYRPAWHLLPAPTMPPATATAAPVWIYGTTVEAAQGIPGDRPSINGAKPDAQRSDPNSRDLQHQWIQQLATALGPSAQLRSWATDSASEAALMADLQGAIEPLTILWVDREPSTDWQSPAPALATLQTETIPALLRLIRAIHHQGKAANLTLKLITFNTHRVLDSEQASPPNLPMGAVLAGIIKVLRREYPKLRVTGFDLDLHDPHWQDATTAAAGFQQLLADSGDPWGRAIAWRRGQRFVQALAQLSSPSPTQGGSQPSPMLTPRGVVVIAGGKGGIGRTIGHWLAEQCQSRLVLLGRRAPDEAIQQQLTQIQQAGGEAIYLQADMTDPQQLHQAFQTAFDRFGQIDAVIHSALILEDSALHRLTEAAMAHVLAPKVAGSLYLSQAAIAFGAKLLVFFSSANVFYGTPGQANYVAGGTFKDAWAGQLAGSGLIQVQCLNWGFWEEVGIVASPDYRARMAQLEVAGIDCALGLAGFAWMLGSGLRQALVLRCGAAMQRELGLVGDRPLQCQLPGEGAYLSAALARMGDRTDPVADRALAESLAVLEEVSQLALLAAFPQRSDLATTHEGARALSLALFPLWEAAAARPGWRDQAAQWESVRDRVAQQFPELTPHLQLLSACVAQYPRLWRGEVAGHEILFPQGSSELVAPVYASGSLAERMNATVVAVLAAWQAERGPDRPLRILEIGAGTGATAAVVLAALQDHPQLSYVFTDISPALVRRATDRLGHYRGCQFQTLNIEQDPIAQGFTPGSFDVVLAANVLHATANMDATLSRAKLLLGSHGLLILAEATSSQLFSTMTFGVTKGWWAHDPDQQRLPGGPCWIPKVGKPIWLAQGFRGFGRSPSDLRRPARSARSVRPIT